MELRLLYQSMFSFLMIDTIRMSNCQTNSRKEERRFLFSLWLLGMFQKSHAVSALL